MVEKEAKALDLPESLDLTEADVLEAMKEIPGYLDITPRDFKEIYHHGLPPGPVPSAAGSNGGDDHDQGCGGGIRRNTLGRSGCCHGRTRNFRSAGG